ncbi:hypothetical protein PCE1_001689 [Barthelona sp. PCE]
MNTDWKMAMESLIKDEKEEVSVSTTLLNDPYICAGFCIDKCAYTLLSETKCGVHRCPHKHIPELRAKYQSLSEPEKDALGLEYVYLKELKVAHRILNAVLEEEEQRLFRATADQYDEIVQGTDTSSLNVASESLSGLKDKVTEMAVSGEVEAAFALLQRKENIVRHANNFKTSMQQIGKQFILETSFKEHSRAKRPKFFQQALCPWCVGQLAVNDPRITDHFLGKVHSAGRVLHGLLHMYQHKYEEEEPKQCAIDITRFRRAQGWK